MASLITKMRSGARHHPTELFRVAVRCRSQGAGSDDFLTAPPAASPFNAGQAPPPPAGGPGQPAIGGFGAPAPGGFGAPPPPPPAFGGPQGGFGAPPPAFGGPQGGFGAPPPPPPPPPSAFGGPQGGFGAPQGGFGAPQGGFGAPQGGFGAPQGGFGFGGQNQGFGYAQGFPPQNFRRPRENAPIPDKEPFGLMLLRVGSLGEKELMDLFKEQNPTNVQMLSDTQAHIFFNNREDLLAALAMNGKEEVSFVRVVTSNRLHRLAMLGDTGPFRAHLRNLPQNFAVSDLMELFKDLNCQDAVILQHSTTLSRYAFVEFPTKDELMKALDLTNSDTIKGIVVNPASKRVA